MRSVGRALVLSVASASVASTVAGTGFAGGGVPTDAYEGIRPSQPIDVHGLVDVYVQDAIGVPSSGALQLRAFDVRDQVPSLELARLTVAHRPETARLARFGLGFRVDAGVGDMADGYLRSDPAAAAHPELSRLFSYVEQAFVTVSPVGHGAVIDVGKFGTPVGLEDNEAWQNWNTSRSLLYTWGEPTAHTGARITVPLAPQVDVAAFWVNGWNANVLGGNGMRSLAWAATWRPTAGLQASATYMAGLEHDPTRLDDPALAFRHELDGVVVYSPASRVSLAASADYAHDAARGGVSWWGVSGYLRVRPLEWLAATVRGEHYADPDGFTTGTAQRIAGLTATLEAKRRVSGVTVIGRIEYRRDQSNEPVFEATAPSRVTRQQTLSLGLMALF